jgi:hypothetical protein
MKKKMEERSWFGKRDNQDRQGKNKRIKELKDEKDMHKIDWDLERKKDMRL